MHLLLYHTFHKRQCAQCVSSDKHGETCFEYCKYKANQRPLIDVVRVDLQGLMEIAAEIDRDHHNSTTITVHNGVETKKDEESDDKTSGVHIEMGTISSTEISSGDKTDEPEILLEI